MYLTYNINQHGSRKGGDSSMEAPDQKVVEEIDGMSQEEMAILSRFAPVGHIYFDSSKPYNAIFKRRFEEVGGMTPALSKKIGW